MTSPLGLSPTGAGPKIFKPVSLLLFIGILVGSFYPSVSKLPFLETFNLKTTGWIWLIIGCIFWLFAVIQFLTQFPKGKLITTGVYSFSRNPIYASWVIFIFPGLAAICNNWIFLLSAVVMCVAIHIYVKEEENQMLLHFGDLYKVYSEKVNRIL